MSQASSPPVFPTVFDPRQCASAERLLLWAKLHLLLFEKLAIQDNFLISRVLADARDAGSKRSPFCDWIERRWVEVALREDVYSLSHLRRDLAKKAKRGDYNPFEDLRDGLRLYRSKRFIAYLGELDECLRTEGAIALWSPQRLGDSLRTNMRRSAEDGSSGLPVDRALEIWHHVERLAVSGRHSRTLYYRHAETLPLHEAALLRRWATLLYISNLPQELKFDLSVPRHTALSLNVVDPIASLDDTEDISDPTIVTGRDCVLLSSGFLSKLTADDIQRLRILSEFKALTEARSSGEPEQMKKCLLSYLRGIAEEAAKITDPSIRKLELQVQIKRRATQSADFVGIVLTIPKLATLAPTLVSLLLVCSLFLKSREDTETMLRERRRDAFTNLQSQRSGFLLDFIHDESQRL